MPAHVHVWTLAEREQIADVGKCQDLTFEASSAHKLFKTHFSLHMLLIFPENFCKTFFFIEKFP